MWRADSLEKTLIVRKTGAKSIRGKKWLRWLHSITVSMDMNLSKLQERVDRGTWYAVVSEVTKSQTWLSDWKATVITVSTSDLVIVYEQFSLRKKNGRSISESWEASCRLGRLLYIYVINRSMFLNQKCNVMKISLSLLPHYLNVLINRMIN